jgi:hypothetical protein
MRVHVESRARDTGDVSCCCRSSKCGSIAPNFARNPAHHVRIDSHSTFWRAKSQIERLFIDVP